MRFLTSFLLSINLLFCACQEVTAPTGSIEQSNVFFSLKDFFEQEKKHLETIQHFKKTVSINDQSEIKELDKLNLDNELSIFIASDINRPAWSDKYKVDSTFSTENQLTSITYLALEETLKTKKIEINFYEGTVAKVLIEKATDNAVAQSKQILNYHVGQGYSVQSNQSMRFSDSKTIVVEVVY